MIESRYTAVFLAHVTATHYLNEQGKKTHKAPRKKEVTSVFQQQNEKPRAGSASPPAQSMLNPYGMYGGFQPMYPLSMNPMLGGVVPMTDPMGNFGTPTMNVPQRGSGSAVCYSCPHLFQNFFGVTRFQL